MTREELIISEAKKHYSGNIQCYDAFLHGAQFAEEHPKNVWHPACEEPKNKPFRIICQDDWGNVEVVEDDVVKFVYQGDWEAYVKDNCIIRWAYISDLLPKGGEK